MEAMASKTGMSKKDVANMITELANMAYSEVKKNGEFVLPGFGKMVKVKRAARMGRNQAALAKRNFTTVFAAI
jgi:DNA-binding protein HU-beta